MVQRDIWQGGTDPVVSVASTARSGGVRPDLVSASLVVAKSGGRELDASRGAYPTCEDRRGGCGPLPTLYGCRKGRPRRLVCALPKFQTPKFNSKVPNFLGRFYVGRAVPGGDSLLDPGKTRHGLVVELGREDDVVFMVPTVQNGLLACRVEFKIQIAAGLHNAMNVFAAAAITISLTTDECVCCCNNYPLFMLLWSYFSVVLTDPGSVPPNWRPTVDEERDDVVPLTSSEFGSQILNLQQTSSLADPANPGVRYCKKCNQLKPPLYCLC